MVLRFLKVLVFLAVFLGALSAVWVGQSYAQAENITITTYYPSPFGDYNQLRSRRLVVGDGTVAWPGTDGEMRVQRTIFVNSDNLDTLGVMIGNDAQIVRSGSDLHFVMTNSGAVRIRSNGAGGVYIMDQGNANHRDVYLRDVFFCNP